MNCHLGKLYSAGSRRWHFFRKRGETVSTQCWKCRLKRNQARLESMLRKKKKKNPRNILTSNTVFQIWTRFKLICSKYHRWFKGQPGQKKARLWQSCLDRKASWGTKDYPCPDLGESMTRCETFRKSSEHLAIHTSGNGHCRQNQMSQLGSEKLFKFREDWEITWPNHVIALAFQLLSLFIPGAGERKRKQGKDNRQYHVAAELYGEPRTGVSQTTLNSFILVYQRATEWKPGQN